MTAQDYVDWTEVSGLYLGNESHLARYRAYVKQLSAEGLHTVVAYHFLKDQQGDIQVGEWRSYNVYEPGTQRDERVQMTADALAAIGAPRLAEAVREAKSHNAMDALTEQMLANPENAMELLRQSNLGDMMASIRESLARNAPLVPGMDNADLQGLANLGGNAPAAKSPQPAPVHETKAEVTALLSAYVTQHAAALQSDIARHGDPRTQPGYSRKARQAELDERHRQQLDVRAQREDVEKLREHLAQLQQKVAKAGGTGKSTKKGVNIESIRRKIKQILREQEARPADQLIPEMREALHEVQQQLQSLPPEFQEQPLFAAEYNPRLEKLGKFDAESAHGRAEITWRKPHGLMCDWGNGESKHVQVTCAFPKGQDALLEGLLHAAEQVQRKFSTLANDWRQQLLDNFYDVYFVQMQDWELEDYELDEDERPTPESVLSKVDGVSIHLTADLRDLETIDCIAHFGIEWDEEHGFQIEWVEQVAPMEKPTATKSAGKKKSAKSVDITFSHSGPALTAAELDQFQAEHNRVLPEEYREFLLKQNGGVPHLNHVIIKQQGQSQPTDVVSFLPLLGAEGIDGVLKDTTGLQWPKSLLPVARIQVPDHTGSPVAGWFLLVLSGKKMGQLICFLPGQMPAGRQELIQGMLSYLGERPEGLGCSSLSDLCSKLKARPVVATPVWMLAIKHGDMAQFLAWLEGGGSTQESHQEYGTPAPVSALDLLVRAAPVEFVKEVFARKLIKPKQVRDSWLKWSRQAPRYHELFTVLPKEMWSTVWQARDIWEHPEIWEELAEAGLNVDEAIDEEGGTPLHHAVQAGNVPAVQWLMAHGADPHKSDKFVRNAFLWAEHGGGHACLPYLRGEGPPQPTREPQPNVAGIEELWAAAKQLPEGTDLQLQVQVQGPATTRIEKAYGTRFHYVLTLGVRRPQVVVKDAATPRQYYLQAGEWPNSLFAPILEWPEITPLWETLTVLEFDWPAALKKRKYTPTDRPDLVAAARAALEQGLNAEEAVARGIQLVK